MSLWSNDGIVDEAAMVGIWVVLRKVGRNGGPKKPIDPVALEAALRKFVQPKHADGVCCWTSDDGAEWHAEVYWPGGLGWNPITSPTPEALGQDLAAFAVWAQQLAEWVRSKPLPDLPTTRARVTAQYGKLWPVPLG